MCLALLTQTVKVKMFNNTNGQAPSALQLSLHCSPGTQRLFYLPYKVWPAQGTQASNCHFHVLMLTKKVICMHYL